tara:strand:- start:6792 stop:6908 length:117 start_codon:yes stop_codon:yes gene_type:complete
MQTKRQKDKKEGASTLSLVIHKSACFCQLSAAKNNVRE